MELRNFVNENGEEVDISLPIAVTKPMKKLVRVIDDKEVDISVAMDFTDKNGTRHPRNVLWLWSDEELWTILQIREPKPIESDDVPPQAPEI